MSVYRVVEDLKASYRLSFHIWLLFVLFYVLQWLVPPVVYAAIGGVFLFVCLPPLVSQGAFVVELERVAGEIEAFKDKQEATGGE